MPTTPLAEQPTRSLTVGILMGVFAVAFQAYAVATAMPRAAEDLGQVGLFAWTFSLFVIGMALSTVLGGRAVDRFGPVLPSALGLALFTTGLVLAGLAPTMLVLVLARLVQGLGGGLINVALMVIVARAYPEHRRAVLMTAFSFCWVLPAFIGPPVAAWVTTTWSWHAAFWILVPFMVVTAALCWRPLLTLQRAQNQRAQNQRAQNQQAQTAGGSGTSTTPGGARPVPVWAALLAAVGLAGVQTGGQRLDLLGGVLAAVGVAMLALTVWRLMPPGFVRFAPGIPVLSWSRMLQAGSFFAAESFLPLSLVQTRGLTLFWAGSVLTIGSIGWTTGSWLQSRPWLRLRRDQIIILGASCGAAGLALGAAGTPIPGAWGIAVVAAGFAVAGFGMGLSLASGSLVVMQLSEHHDLGRNTSSLQVSEHLGNALIIGLAGTIFVLLRQSQPAAVTFTWLLCLPALLALVAALVSRRIGPVANATSGVG